MPSGITAEIYEGKDVSLRDYLMRVGRQMGFAVMQRDSDLDEPVKATEPSSYYERRVPELDARVQELQAMTEAEADVAAHCDFEERHTAWQETKAERAAL